MAGTTLGDWAVWFLMLAICLSVIFIVIIATFTLCTAALTWYTTRCVFLVVASIDSPVNLCYQLPRLRGKPTLAFQLDDNGKITGHLLGVIKAR